MTMIITHCTITGADDNTSISDLRAIKSDFPFIEWGILVGNPDRDGTPRFPSKEWRKEFEKIGSTAALHLCGGAVDKYLDPHQDSDWREEAFSVYRRIQLNISKHTEKIQTKIVGKTVREKRTIII